MTAQRKASRLFWERRDGVVVMLRPHTTTDTFVVLNTPAFFKMIGMPEPTEFTAAMLRQVQQKLRANFAFVNVIDGEYRLTLSGVSGFTINISHGLTKVRYKVHLRCKELK